MGRVLALVIVLTALPSRGDEPSSADLELAKAHFKTGTIYYENRRFPDAAREFEEAYRLSHKPEMLYNMGKSYDGAGDQSRALGAYRQFLGAVPTSTDRPEVEARVHALERLIEHVHLRCNVDGASVILDGAPAGTTPVTTTFELNPGMHQLKVQREGYKSFSKTLVASPGAEQTIEANLPSLQVVKIVEVQEKPTPVYKKWWLWTAVGVVVAGGAITAGVLASEKAPVSGDFAQLPGVR